MKILEFEQKYFERVKDLLVDLQKYALFHHIFEQNQRACPQHCFLLLRQIFPIDWTYSH